MADEKKKKKKSDIRVDSGGTVEEVVSEHSSMKKEKKKKKKKNREIKDDFAGEDGDIAERESEKLGEDALVKKMKSKKRRIDSEAEDAVKKKKSKKKNKEAKPDPEAEDGVKKSKKKIKETKVDSEAEDGVKKSKKESVSDVIGNSESSKVCEKPLVHTDDADKKKGKRKREDTDFGAEENTDKEMKRKSKKKKPSVDSEVEETSLNSTNDAKKKSKEEKTSEDSEVKENNKDSTKDSKKEKKKKEKKQSVDSEVEDNNLNSTKDVKKKSKKKRPSEDLEVEENNKDSTKDAKTKQSVDSEAEENDLNSTKDAKKKRKEKKQSEDSEAEENGLNSPKDAKKKRKKKKKQSEVSEAEENNNDGKDAKKKRKKKQESGKSDKDVTTPSSKSTKRVKFSEQVEFFPAEDEETAEEDDEEEVKVVRGKRFTKEEDELVKNAVLEYIDNHALGDEGIDMVMECKSHPQLKGCWKEIASALPWRTYMSVYNRAHTIFEAGSKGIWTEEDFELVKDFQKKHGNDWRTLADAMGKHRKHVKDAWRRIRLASKNKGHWTREEYQVLFDLVNKDLRMKAFKEKHAKHGMLRDSIPWMAISDVLGTRDHVTCCTKWYDQLTSPMVAKGLWANVDDYRLLEELLKLDAACIDDVEWDNLLDNRDGEACRKRFHQMVLHIGVPKSKTFAEQVEILSDRYRPDLAEDREDFDNRPYDPED